MALHTFCTIFRSLCHLTLHVLMFAARNGFQMRFRNCANCKRTCENPNPQCWICIPGCGCPTNVPISHDGNCITLRMCRGLSHITTVTGMQKSSAKWCDPEIMTNCVSLSNNSSPTSPHSCVNCHSLQRLHYFNAKSRDNSTLIITLTLSCCFDHIHFLAICTFPVIVNETFFYAWRNSA